MKKAIISISIFSILSSAVLACGGNYTGCGLKGSHMYGGGLSWLIWKPLMFIIMAFVFSVIFWWTKGWLESKCTKKKKK